MASSTNNPAAPGSQDKSSSSPRSNPVCLEVLVTLRSLPTEAGNQSQPIREELKTVIVFDNGAVLRSANNLAAGLTLILSNAAKRDVVCRVVSGRSMPSVKGYVEVEFIEPVKDFWGIHQETMPTPQLNPVEVPPPPAPVAQAAPPTPARTPTATAPTTPAPNPPVQQAAFTPQVWPTVPSSLESSPRLASAGLAGTPEFDEFPGPMSDPWPSVATPTPKLAPASSPFVSAQPPINSKVAYEKPTPSYEQVAVTGSTSVADWNTSVAEPAAVRPAPPAVADSPSSAPSSAAGRDFMSKGLMAYEQPTEAKSGAGGRMPLLLGAAAVALAAIGGVAFFMHRGNSPTPVASAMSAASQPVATQPALSKSEPVQSSRQSEAPAPSRVEAQPEPQPIAAVPTEPSVAVKPIPAAEISDATASASHADSRSRQQDKPAAATKQPDSASSKRPTLSNLKIGAPTAPKNHLGDGGDGAVPITEIASAEMPAEASSANLLTSSGRTASAPPPPPSAPAPPPPVKSVTEPKLISSTRPNYPQTARQANIEGSVSLVIYIDQTGKVSSARALNGPVMLRAAAEDAVKQWKYSPALEDGKPAQSHTVVKVDFKLN